MARQNYLLYSSVSAIEMVFSEAGGRMVVKVGKNNIEWEKGRGRKTKGQVLLPMVRRMFLSITVTLIFTNNPYSQTSSKGSKPEVELSL